MLRLGLPREPRWLDLGYGVRVRVRPINAAVLGAARSEAQALGRQLRDDRTALLLAGLDPANLPNLDDEHALAGIAEALLAKILARATIEAWEGVLARDGDGPAEPTPAAIADLMEFPHMAAAFLARSTAPLDALVTEGNGSGTAPNGTMAAVPPTATGAETSGSPAPAASA
jgi:hypothetical protein